MSCLTALSGATGPTGGQKNGGPVDAKCDVKVGKDGELQIVRIDQKDDGVFKKPVPPGPRTALRQKALDEDVYTSSLKAIIERDYFPELPYLRAKQELDDAMQSRDPVRIKEAYANLRKCAMTPSGRYLSTPKRGLGASASSTPQGGTGRVSAPGTPGNRGRSSTPMGFDGDDHSVCLTNEDDLEREEEINRVIKGRSLDDFVKKYTSEDNKSASELMLKDAVAMEDRRMWIHEQAAEYNMRQKLLIERGPRQEDGTLNMILGAPYDEKDSLTSYVPSTHYIPKTVSRLLRVLLPLTAGVTEAAHGQGQHLIVRHSDGEGSTPAGQGPALMPAACPQLTVDVSDLLTAHVPSIRDAGGRKVTQHDVAIDLWLLRKSCQCGRVAEGRRLQFPAHSLAGSRGAGRHSFLHVGKVSRTEYSGCC